MAIEEIPEGHAVVRFTYDTKDAEASLKRLGSSEAALQAARQSGLTTYNANLAKMGEQLAGLSRNFDAEIPKWKSKFSQAADAIELMGNKLKDVGKGFISGAIGGLASGFLGGGIGSLVQQMFQPPSDDDLQRWAGMTAEVSAWGKVTGETTAQLSAWDEALRRSAQTEIDHREATRRAAEAMGGFLSVVEGITKQNAIQSVSDQLKIAEANLLMSGGASETARLAFNQLERQLRNLRGEIDLVNKGLGGVIGGSDDSSQKRRRGKSTDSGFLEGVAGGFENLAYGAAGYVEDEVKALREALAAERARQKDDQRVEMEARRGTDDFYARAAEAAGNMANVQRAGDEPSWLARVFGPVEEFSVYQAALSSFTDSVGQAYDSIVAGTMSGGEAIKSIIKSTVQALGKQAQIEALLNLGKGFAALALGPIGGASAGAYFKAAAILEGAAIAAGVAAAAIGGGGGASAGSGSAPYSGGGGGSQPAQTTHNHYYGDDFAHSSYRDRQRQADDEERDRRGGGAGVS